MKRNYILPIILYFMIEQLSAQQRVVFKPQTTRLNINIERSANKNIVVQTTPIDLGLRPTKPNQKNITLDKNGAGFIDVFLRGPSVIKIMNIWTDSSVDYLVMPGKTFSITLNEQERSFARYGGEWEKENDFYEFMMTDAQRRLDEIPQNDPNVFIREWSKQNEYSFSLIQIANEQGTDPNYTAWVLQSVHALFYATLIRQLIHYITITGEWPANMQQYIHSMEPLNEIEFGNPSSFTSESDKEWVEQYYLFEAACHYYDADSSQVPVFEKLYKNAITGANKIKEPGVRKVMMQYLAKSAVERTNDLGFLEWLRNSLKNQTEFRYYNTLIDSRSELLTIAPKGKTALAFNAEDKDGNAFSFDDYKGKYIYIDIWATWCIPCRKQIPYLDRLKEKYAHKSIAFISISEDKSLDDWRKYLNNIPNISGQFISDPDLKESISHTYMIRLIPKFILIDPAGKIVSTNCYMPSDPALEMLLEKLLN